MLLWAGAGARGVGAGATGAGAGAGGAARGAGAMGAGGIGRWAAMILVNSPGPGGVGGVGGDAVTGARGATGGGGADATGALLAAMPDINIVNSPGLPAGRGGLAAGAGGIAPRELDESSARKKCVSLTSFCGFAGFCDTGANGSRILLAPR